MKKLIHFLLLLIISMALCLMVFAVLNGFNPLMAWLTGKLSLAYIFIFCITVIVTAVLVLSRMKR